MRAPSVRYYGGPSLFISAPSVLRCTHVAIGFKIRMFVILNPPSQNQIPTNMKNYNHARLLTWMCMGALLLQSCRKDDDTLGGVLGNLGGPKSFSNCNAPIGTTISVASFGAC